MALLYLWGSAIFIYLPSRHIPHEWYIHHYNENSFRITKGTPQYPPSLPFPTSGGWHSFVDKPYALPDHWQYWFLWSRNWLSTNNWLSPRISSEWWCWMFRSIFRLVSRNKRLENALRTRIRMRGFFREQNKKRLEFSCHGCQYIVKVLIHRWFLWQPRVKPVVIGCHIYAILTTNDNGKTGWLS